MTINPIPLDDFPRTGRPWNNITPFTYRDGLTYLEVLEALRAWVRDVLTAHLNDEMEEFAENWNQVLNDFQVAVIESFDQKMEEFDVDVQAFKDAVNEQFATLRQSLEADIASQLTTVNDALAAWDETYATFTANIQALVDQWTTVQIENNDVITEQIIRDPESATRATLDAIIVADGVERFGIYNVMDYGATGDGVADDRPALNAVVEAANVNGGTVVLPPGKYFMGSHGTIGNMGPQVFQRYGAIVKDNVTVYGMSGSEILDDRGYADRMVILLLEGSNITIDGVSTRSIHLNSEGSRPTSIGVGAGDGFRADFDGHMRNIRIVNCNFRRSWHPIKFDFKGPDGIATCEAVTVENCYSYGDEDTSSSGGYLFGCKEPGRIKNVTIADSVSDMVTASAAIGLYGVFDANVNGNRCTVSGGSAAGIQAENGARRVTITGNTLVDHHNGIWADDSDHVTITGNVIISNENRSNDFGIRVTHQGHESNPDQIVTAITIDANTLKNCTIRLSSFSTSIGNSRMDDIIIRGNTVSLDGATHLAGILFGAVMRPIVQGNIVTGAREHSIRLQGTSGGQTYVITDNITDKVGAEDSVGLTILTGFGLGTVSNNMFKNGIVTEASRVLTGTVGEVSIRTGTQDPVNALTGNPGDLYLRQGATDAETALYVKTGSGFLGWVAR